MTEVEKLNDLIYGEHGLDERLKAADAAWSHWQIKANELETKLAFARGEGMYHLSGAKLAELLVKYGVVQNAAVNDAEDYDNGATVGGIYAAASDIRLESRGGKCKWVKHGGGRYGTECGCSAVSQSAALSVPNATIGTTYYIDGVNGPFCQHCGRPITED